jgi:hypothetical protein
MGDTITHLRNFYEIERLIQHCSQLLIDTGKIVFSFRDLTKELKNEDRFIPVKQDHERILTCFLEHFTDYVMVHDILYERENDEWIQKISSYPKIKISEHDIENILSKNRLKITCTESINRMIYIIAEKI